MMTKNQMNERNQLEMLVIEQLALENRQKASRDELSMPFSSEPTPIVSAQSVLVNVRCYNGSSD